MRSAVRVLLVALILAAALVATNSSAQSLTPCVRTVFFSMEPGILSGGVNNKLAYTAVVTKTFEQKLYDGNTLHWTVQDIQARDQGGREMRQHIEGCIIDIDGQQQLRIRTSIYDRAAKTNTSWLTGPGAIGLATIFHTQIPSPHPNLADVPHTPMPREARPQITTEELGTKTIAGLEATGRRRTEIIPADAEGNDAPLKSTTDTWTSVKDHIVLMSVTDNPRMGHYSWEVTTLTFGPPNPALFTPPADYKFWDNEPQAVAASKPQ